MNLAHGSSCKKKQRFFATLSSFRIQNRIPVRNNVKHADTIEVERLQLVLQQTLQRPPTLMKQDEQDERPTYNLFRMTLRTNVYIMCNASSKKAVDQHIYFTTFAQTDSRLICFS